MQYLILVGLLLNHCPHIWSAAPRSPSLYGDPYKLIAAHRHKLPTGCVTKLFIAHHIAIQEREKELLAPPNSPAEKRPGERSASEDSSSGIVFAEINLAQISSPKKQLPAQPLIKKTKKKTPEEPYLFRFSPEEEQLGNGNGLQAYTRYLYNHQRRCLEQANRSLKENQCIK